MSDHLTLIDSESETGQSPAWTLIPPKAVRQQLYKKIKGVRRPAGTLALPAIGTTATAYFTHTLPHSDTVMALGLTSLVVFYDSVTAVCRTWHKTSTTALQCGETTVASKRAA
ncbi:hypothetical protein ACFRFU_52350 [Streptomyces sp. NPDC056704]|uniref:hypothetical protein n=1 Tax=Streptomyces sp. NPDC056704 TaxID=3345917 RepID=UPI0036B1E167